MHICHQIRMQGAESTFQDQTDVVCWIECNKMLKGVEPDAVIQPTEPRLFATHLSDYDIIPKANRIIYGFRDQMDALYSLYCMMDSLLILKGRIPLGLFADAFVESGLVRKRTEQLLGWWKRRHQDNILLMFYDDLKEDHSGCVHRIAKFMALMKLLLGWLKQPHMLKCPSIPPSLMLAATITCISSTNW